MVMRRRFGRRRQREDGARPIDESWLGKAAEALPIDTLTRTTYDEIPASLALTGTGAADDGGTWLVAVSPGSAVDALLAALATVGRHSEELAGVAVASPHWDSASRRLLGSVMGLGRGIRSVVLTEDTARPVESPPLAVPLDRLADQLGDPAARSSYQAAVSALAGLAAKHDGGLRTRGATLELVIAGAALAELRADGDRAVLETLVPNRESHALGDARLAEVTDRLEGQVRKRANDKKIRDGEEGIRGRLASTLAAHAGVHSARRWPLAGAGAEAIDAVGVGADGVPVIIGARQKLGLEALAGVLRGAQAAEGAIAALTASAPPPVRLGSRPRLLLAGISVEPAVRSALSHLTLPVQVFESRDAAGPVSAIDLGAPVPAVTRPPARSERDRSADADEAEAAEAEASPDREPREREASDASARDGEADDRPRRRRRRRGGKRGGGSGSREADGDGDEGSASAATPTPTPEPAEPAGFEELSLFDLGDGDDEEPAPRRRRRRRSGGGDRDSGPEGSKESGRANDRDAAEAGSDDDDDDADEMLELSPDAPDLDDADVPAYDEEEDDEPESEADRIRNERERRRRARASAAPAIAASEASLTSVSEETEQTLPRGRAAILAHGDRESITAAVLLAREIRQIEGIWIYPQEELMTFFRGVATDLRDNTPIYVIGFAAKPAREALQAASLYRGRLVWFDHHEWPPEDIGEIRELLGENFAQIRPGANSSLPTVLTWCTRRSRFSDKLVDLVTGRFSQHDFQRWGRLWWWRLGELMTKTGEHRGNLEMLLAGRPSDLAKEAARAKQAPPPAELEWVAGRDFRLVHFGGMAMVVADVPAELDLHMAMRIARERYGVALSFARVEGDDVFILGADDVTGKRAVDVGGMVAHLDQKFGWITALSDEDHVARLRARGAATNADRAEELIAEIGMGRTILEG